MNEIPHTIMNGQHKKKETPIDILIHSVKNLTIANIVAVVVTIGSISGILFGAYSFISTTNNVNKEIPEIKKVINEHEKKDDEKNIVFLNTLNEIKLSVKDIQGDIKLVNQKVDDMKANGFGRYHEDTRELIRKTQ